ncbi:MAG: TIGR04086 family membrane protein, partial [Clostridia bacterium]|nr:TIGR04086 family membrane protein [Clostridia bacterium]
MKKRGKEKKPSFKGGALKASLIGSLGAIAVFILLISLFSAIGLSFENPHAYVPPLSYLAIYGASFFGGFIASKKNRGHNALLCGLICGVILCLA